MGSNTRGQSVEVSIESLSSRGNGVGNFLRHDGQSCPIEIPFTVVGDKVQAEVGRRRAGRYSGRLQELLSASSDRISPRCIHFATCGGCRWQQLPYAKQLEIKQERVEALFGAKTLPIIACPKIWGYRNKMELSFSQDREGKQFLGLVIDASRGKVFDMSECHLCNPWMAEACKAVKSWWQEENLSAYHMFTHSGHLRTLTLREGIKTGDRMAILTVSGNPDYALNKEQIRRFVQTLNHFIPENGRLSLFLRIMQVKKGMTTQVYEMHLAGPDHIFEKIDFQGKNYTFKISPAAFFQPNTLQAESLFEKAFELAGGGECVFDLYCGTGVLGILASAQAKKVFGIELVPEAVLDARENAKINQVEDIVFLGGKVEDKLASLQEKPDLVMVDPPRAGLDPKAIEQLVLLKAPKILYISCNPVSQKANVEALEANGYQTRSIQPVDQFPHTVHIENIVVLQR